MAINANANGIPFLKRYGIPPAIKNSMVLWYDIARQGATNESMAENPILKDLSGNGHDITCYNFAWSGMSGIGGYTENFTDSSTFYNWANRNVHTVTGNTIHITEVNSAYPFFARKLKDGETGIDSFTFKISGISESGLTLFINYSSTNLLTIKEDGEYTIPAFIEDEIIEDYAYYWNMMFDRIDINKTCNITIEQLPLYSNALVSDGVDDYYQVLPTYPKEVGTCFLTAQSLKEDSTSFILYMSHNKEESGFISSWRGTTVGVGSRNRIMLRNVDGEGKEIRKESSSVLSGKGTIVFTWNNNIPLMVGRINDERIELGLEQPHTKYSWGTDFNGGCTRKKFAFYSFLLFDRDLTEQEIEWVKKNMIEGGTEI